LKCHNAVGIATAKLSDFGNLISHKYCWTCHSFAPLIKQDTSGSVTMIDFFTDDLPVWTGAAFRTSIELRQQALEVAEMIADLKGEERPHLPAIQETHEPECISCGDMIGEISMDHGNGYVNNMPYCWLCHTIQPWTTSVGGTEITHQPGPNSPVFVDGLWTTPALLRSKEVLSLLALASEQVGEEPLAHYDEQALDLTEENLVYNPPRVFRPTAEEKTLMASFPEVVPMASEFVGQFFSARPQEVEMTEATELCSFPEAVPMASEMATEVYPRGQPFQWNDSQLESAIHWINANMSQDQIGMLGGACSKGDGVYDRERKPYSRRNKQKSQEGKQEESEPLAERVEPRLNSRDPPQKKKIWKEKRGGSSGKKGNLVQAQMTQDLQKLLGENDAMKELVQEIVEERASSPSLSSPSSPPTPPSADPPISPDPPQPKPKKLPVHHLPVSSLKIDFLLSTHVMNVGLLLHVLALLIQLMGALVPKLMQEQQLVESGSFFLLVDALVWTLFRMTAGLLISPLSVILDPGFLTPHLMIMILLSVHAIKSKVFLYSSTRGHRYMTVGTTFQLVQDDARADILALGEIKHPEPLLQHVMYENSTLFEASQTILTVSLELLTQISTSINLDLSYTEELVWQHIRHSANHFQSVNIDRYQVLNNVMIVQDTCLVAYGLWKHMQQERSHLLFPRSQ
jgi:uncharacterized membrane protein YqaE (UPF0057 family)